MLGYPDRLDEVNLKVTTLNFDERGDSRKQLKNLSLCRTGLCPTLLSFN